MFGLLFYEKLGMQFLKYGNNMVTLSLKARICQWFWFTNKLKVFTWIK